MITVVIPPQEYSRIKYLGFEGPCYLEEALTKAGYVDASVSCYGHTNINGKYFKPKDAFNNQVVEKAFDKGESITVELIPSL